MWLLAPNGSVLGISVQHSFATLKFFMASVSGKFYDKKNKLPYSSHCIVHTVFLYLPTYLPTHLPTYSPTYLLTYLPTHSLTYLPTYLPTYHLPSYLLTHSLTNLPTYLPTVPPTYQGFVYLTKRYTGPEAHWHSSSFRRHRSTLQIHPNMLFVGKIPSYYLTNIPQVEQHLWSHHFVF